MDGQKLALKLLFIWGFSGVFSGVFLDLFFLYLSTMFFRLKSTIFTIVNDGRKEERRRKSLHQSIARNFKKAQHPARTD